MSTQQTSQVNGQLILQKAILNRLLDQKTDSENFKMGDLSINDEMQSMPVQRTKKTIPKNNAIFKVSDTVFDKLEKVENDSTIRNFIEIEGKFYALEDVTLDCMLIKDTTQGSEEKYFIGMHYSGKYLIINKESRDIIINVTYLKGEQAYTKFIKKHQIYNKDIMDEVQLLQTKLQKLQVTERENQQLLKSQQQKQQSQQQQKQKTIYLILIVISIFIILLLIYIIYISYYKKPKVVIEEENDIDNENNNYLL